jgi:hypothetical protein
MVKQGEPVEPQLPRNLVKQVPESGIADAEAGLGFEMINQARKRQGPCLSPGAGPASRQIRPVSPLANSRSQIIGKYQTAMVATRLAPD